VSLATGLDHVGIAVHDLAAAAAEFEALGFQVTPTAPHLPGGITGNRCVMLGQGYLELLAVIDPAGRSATVEKFLARYQGIHVISLATDDAEAAGKRLQREVIRSERPTDQGTARFARVALTELTPRLQLIQHLTPDLVWRAQDCVHRNGAQALVSVVMTAASPAGAAADLARTAGRVLVPDCDSGFALRLGKATVRVLDDIGKIFPALAVPSQPFVAGVEIRTGNAALAGQVRIAAGVAIRFIG
jgi:hypothetical protein